MTEEVEKNEPMNEVENEPVQADLSSEEGETLDGKKEYHETFGQEEVNFILDQEQRAKCANEIVDITEQRVLVEKEFDAVKKKFKEQLAVLDADMASIIHKIQNGVDKVINCKKRVWPVRGIVELIDENGEVFRERKITDEDRQLQLDTRVSPDAFVSESDSFDAGSGSQNYDENHKKAKEALAQELVEDEDAELEKVTERDLTSNKPTDF